MPDISRLLGSSPCDPSLFDITNNNVAASRRRLDSTDHLRTHPLGGAAPGACAILVQVFSMIPYLLRKTGEAKPV